jgi:hypothetical protein
MVAWTSIVAPVGQTLILVKPEQGPEEGGDFSVLEELHLFVAMGAGDPLSPTVVGDADF